MVGVITKLRHNNELNSNSPPLFQLLAQATPWQYHPLRFAPVGINTTESSWIPSAVYRFLEFVFARLVGQYLW